MYRCCIYCHNDLGGNSLLEVFPIGQRLAFDRERGRLWVICPACARWNLTPLETRWEALDQCERLFSTLRRRVATESIALGWSPEGLQLIRIGGDTPGRELAAWRYGRRLLRRRLRLLPIAVGAAGLGGLAAGAFLGGIAAGLYVTVYAVAVLHPLASPDHDRIVAEVRLGGGRILSLTRRELKALTIGRTAGGGYLAHLPRFVGRRGTALVGRADSERVFRAVLPLLNRYGGSARGVNAAITRLEQAGDPERFLGTLAERQATISKLDKESRLAFEMALHEQAERNAMSGELSALEDAWREAEDLARVADTLGLPSWLSNAYRRR